VDQLQHAQSNVFPLLIEISIADEITICLFAIIRQGKNVALAKGLPRDNN
jgi:hypothetical protein